MTIETVPGTDIQYYLVNFDKHGAERADDPDGIDGKLSARVLRDIGERPVTDVFFISHGWQGDVPAAKRQYNKWIAAMAQCTADREAMRVKDPAFTPLLVGLHWPSLPWGKEDPDSHVAFSLGPDGSGDDLIDEAAEAVADTPRARQALETIFAAAADNLLPETLPDDVVEAYRVLFEEAGLAAEGPAGAPGADAEDFDPETAYQNARSTTDIAFGGGFRDGLLAPLRQMSFWQMKKRARTFGESGATGLLRAVMTTKPGSDRESVRVHLMGHSFGCIVMSATVAAGGTPLPRPVDTLYLVQGAFSLWSCSRPIPVAKNKNGYFRPIVEGRVRGPILTTVSEHDTAVGKLYPLAAGVAGQITYGAGEMPKYGAVGAFGLQGDGFAVEDRVMPKADDPTAYSGGRVYNLDAGEFICEGGGLSGAHNDIAKPEVAHAFWRAMISAV